MDVTETLRLSDFFLEIRVVSEIQNGAQSGVP